MPTTIEERDRRRDVVLGSIAEYNQRCSQLFSDIRDLRAALTEAETLGIKALWEVLQLRKHISDEVLEQIRIDKKVNEVDPDFSFEQAVKTMLKE